MIFFAFANTHLYTYVKYVYVRNEIEEKEKNEKVGYAFSDIY